MTSFKLDKQCSIAQFISKDEVIARIEMHAVDFLLKNETEKHEFQMIVRTRENFVQTDDVVRLGEKVKKRKIGATISKKTYEQTWACLSHIHKHLLQGKITTQRDMYYCLINYFDSQKDLNERIQDTVSLLEVPRSCLGLFATSRGFIAGSLLWNEGNGWIDGTKISCPGIPIPGMIPENLRIESDARYIIVIEKDGVFRRILEDRFFKLIPCIILTGCGFPDLSTRIVLHHLEKQLKIPALGLFDYNPYGVSILSSYMFGSLHMGLETFQYAVPSMKWLGIHSAEVESLKLTSVSMTSNDEKKLDSVIKDFEKYEPILKELNKMKELGVKVEIQALNNLGFSYMTSEYLKTKILKKQFLSNQ